jgi:hypothetical protein
MDQSALSYQLAAFNRWLKPRTPKVKFTADEDRKLRVLVGASAAPDWTAIARELPNRTPRQCRERWQHYLAPQVSVAPWTPAEDALLATLQSVRRSDWAGIASVMLGQTNNAVKNRWHTLQRRVKGRRSARSQPPNEQRADTETNWSNDGLSEGGFAFGLTATASDDDNGAFFQFLEGRFDE